MSTEGIISCKLLAKQRLYFHNRHSQAQRRANPRFIIQNWMRNRNTVEFLGLLELLNNQNYNRIEFDTFRMQAGINSSVQTPQKWIDATDAVGIISKAGRYDGAYAHKEIALSLHLGCPFKLYLVKEFDRLNRAKKYGLSR